MLLVHRESCKDSHGLELCLRLCPDLSSSQAVFGLHCSKLAPNMGEAMEQQAVLAAPLGDVLSGVWRLRS